MRHRRAFYGFPWKMIGLPQRRAGHQGAHYRCLRIYGGASYTEITAYGACVYVVTCATLNGNYFNSRASERAEIRRKRDIVQNKLRANNNDAAAT